VDRREESANQQDQEVNLHICTFGAAPLQLASWLQSKVRSSFLSRSGEGPENFRRNPV
jgi:hypothetical protein